MKKLFLTSGLILCMTCSAYATDPTDIGYSSGSYGSSGCADTYLDTYDDPASLEAKWDANISGAITLDSNRYAASNSPTAASTASTAAAVSPVYSKYNTGIYSDQACQTAVTQLSTLPAMTGYSFQGFYTGKAGTGNQVIDSSGDYKSAASTQVGSAGGQTTFYAHWTPRTNQISYATGTAGARTTGFSGTMEDTDAIYDASVTLRANAFSIPGYDFAGWTSTKNLTTGATASSSYGDGATINPYRVDADVTLTATWTAKTYTVTYNKGAHAASGVNNYEATNDATYDSNYTARTFSDATNSGGAGMTAAAGYTFRGWSTAENPTVTESGGVYTVSNAWTGETPWTRTTGLTVYAAYSPNSINITFNCGKPVSGQQIPGSSPAANYAASASENTSANPANHAVTMDTSTALTETCTLQGWTFDGWSCSAGLASNSDGSNAITFISRAQVTAQGGYQVYMKGGSTVTCTAKWTQNTINLQWNPDGGVAQDGTSAYSAGVNSCNYDSTFTLPPAPRKNGYQFNGWTVTSTSN